MTATPNVALVRRLFSSWAAGDAPTAVNILSPQIRYYGYDHKRTARNCVCLLYVLGHSR